METLHNVGQAAKSEKDLSKKQMYPKMGLFNKFAAQKHYIKDSLEN